LWLVAIALLVAAVGCSTGHGKQKSAQTQAQHGSDSSATASTGARHEGGTGAAHPKAEGAQPTNRVRLTEHGCVQFEPQWASIRVGQPLAFSSELKSPVTIHVSPGAFEKTEYLVRPGTITNTGPARVAGSYSMWSEPAACQGAPLGARGTGPGVTVEGAEPR